MYGAFRVYRYMGRLQLARMLDQLVAQSLASSQPDEGQQPGGPPQGQTADARSVGKIGWNWVAVGEGVRYAWLGLTWLAAAVLGASGLWCFVRLRVVWRFLLLGAVATLVAAAGTVFGAYALVRWAGYPPLSGRIYAIAFLIHFAPAGVIFAAFAASRLFMADEGRPARREG